MGASIHNLLREPQVVVKGVKVFRGVEQVAGVAEGNLGDGGSGLEHRVDSRTHLGDVVESVEDAEDVHAGGGRLPHEGIRHLGGVGRIAHRVSTAQQHLDGDIRERLA